jgi:hypothetical protein
MVTVGDRFEYAIKSDPSLNYCLWEYPPPVSSEDKFRSINLLYHSFALAHIDARAYDIVEAIRDEIGPFRTVFGIKLLDGRLAWEFYFYDYQRRQRQVSIARVLAAIRPYIACPVKPNEALPYFMFSLDLSDEYVTGCRALDVVHMYMGNPGSTVSSGVAYAVRQDSTTLENFYFFFDAASQLQDAAKKIANSAVFDETRLSIDAVLVPELRDCRTICVANKRTHDCVYFSGVNVSQLLWFLTALKYPARMIDFVRDNCGNLDHLLFDVGFDYRQENGRLHVLKSGYYGIF